MGKRAQNRESASKGHQNRLVFTTLALQEIAPSKLFIILKGKSSAEPGRRSRILRRGVVLELDLLEFYDLGSGIECDSV